MQKVFCKNLLCKKRDRKNRCCDCGVWLCKLCSITSMVKTKKIYCVNCYLKTFSPDWIKLNEEFDEMLQLKPIEKVNKWGVAEVKK